MSKDTMKKTSKIAKQASPPGSAPGAKGRLPVAPAKAPARLAGRGGEKTVAVVSDFGEELEEMEGWAQEVLRINKEKADLETEASMYRGLINKAMASVKKDESWTVRSENSDWVATYIVPKEGKKLVPELLLQAGVKADQLKKGYKTIPAKAPYVQVRTKGEAVGENEEHE